MRLKHLGIRHFRNLKIQDLQVPPEGVAVVGENAQGKTNLLEAVYYLETFRSFRGCPDDELLAFGEDVFRVSASFEDPGDCSRRSEVAAGFQRRGRQKKVSVDGSEPDRLADAVGRVAAVLFSPADVSIVSGGPDERRRFLDVVLSLNVPGYLAALQRFRHVLSQRNAALREEQPPDLVRAWNEPLVRAGAEVTSERRTWICERTQAFSRFHETVSGGQAAALAYEPGVALDGAPGTEDIAAAYGAALDASSPRERRLGMTVVGPHRDEMAVRILTEGGEMDVRRFGSGGQRRTAALALRLVEAETIRETRGREPLVLLDDVFAELDAGRSERVLELIERQDGAQVILTAPKESDVRVRARTLPRWRIRDGRIAT